ncbi:erv1 / alr family domain-containing protein [Ditylenchus destructor]|nr:erv1 / alr family domain-containing protein [Ditylenchus destructor]
MVLDLYPFRANVGVRRALSTSPLISMLKIASFPYVAMFRRGDQQSIFMDQLRPTTVQDILNRAQPGQVVTQAPTIATTKKLDVINCEANPERCKPMYFVSETDMLKAMRSALLDEVVRADDIITGQHFGDLHNFVSLLAEYFPTITFAQGNDRSRRVPNKRSTSMVLVRSERAKLIFLHLKNLLEQKQGSISANEWQHQFESIERVYAYPFPVNATWQHCRGSSPEFRGYTCGLWTTFHTLTVHTYMDSIKTRKVHPMRPLQAIQGWVNSFFGCQHCRNHFMKMTTETFPMNEQRVRHVHDMVMYLWRAHNIVNNRLHGDVTEDPQFLKYQFPPLFLCPSCHAGGHFSRRQVRNFLLRYYSNIKPAHRTHSYTSTAVRNI